VLSNIPTVSAGHCQIFQLFFETTSIMRFLSTFALACILLQTVWALPLIIPTNDPTARRDLYYAFSHDTELLEARGENKAHTTGVQGPGYQRPNKDDPVVHPGQLGATGHVTGPAPPVTRKNYFGALGMSIKRTLGSVGRHIRNIPAIFRKKDGGGRRTGRDGERATGVRRGTGHG